MPPNPPAHDVQIRRADLADGDQVGQLAERVYRQGGWADERYLPVLLDGRSRIEEAEVLVAEAAGAILGTATVARPGTRFAGIAQPDEVEIRILAVDQAARGRGVADRLMAACESLARDQGFAAVVLCTEPDMYAAQRLYERRGYVRQPGRDRSIGRLMLLAYRLSLNPG
jgi:ribosomal protein S18 acetylase RimI-like enzyme